MTERLSNNNHILGTENRDCVRGKGQNSLLFCFVLFSRKSLDLNILCLSPSLPMEPARIFPLPF